MPYVINKTNGQPLLTLDDGVLDTTTSLSLVGRNFVGYGELQRLPKIKFIFKAH